MQRRAPSQSIDPPKCVNCIRAGIKIHNHVATADSCPRRKNRINEQKSYLIELAKTNILEGRKNKNKQLTGNTTVNLVQDVAESESTEDSEQMETTLPFVDSTIANIVLLINHSFYANQEPGPSVNWEILSCQQRKMFQCQNQLIY